MIRDILGQDTICAIATPVGIGGIGIVRISGKNAVKIAEKIFRPASASFPLASHRLYYGWIYDPETGSLIDEVLLSVMKSPRTYTREDVVEINCHSGYAVLEEILRVVMAQGARLAAPGEFTYRAFLHGRIDLSQAEAVQEIVSSRSRASLDMARRQLQGECFLAVTNWIETLTDILAHIEAHLDFPEDVEDESESGDLASDGDSIFALNQLLTKRLEDELIQPIRRVLKSFDSVQLLREGVSLALVGKPNVGKSSLLNALLEKDRAIVTEYAGTTRDVIEDSFTIDGVLVRIMDTAGIREKADYIEALGIERTLRVIKEANIILWLLDVSENLTREDDYIFEIIKDSRYLMLINKADLPHRWEESVLRSRYDTRAPVIMMSAKRKEDVESLKNFIREHFLKQAIDDASESFAINKRHNEHLVRALESLERARLLLEGENGEEGRTRHGALHFLPPYELIAYELESARKELNAIVGKEASMEDVLDRVFSQFCIGK
ncbi:MAG: tRNA uridine-5-carboxymethylaminomethyl(34) synthesis GTPase MnmE [Thermodesulforhabdaceae bacterium]